MTDTSLARDEDILKAAEDWRKQGRGVALATVVETWGSAPRPVGANLVIDGEGNFLGSVSGGCVEGAVVTEALDVIADGKPRTLGIRCCRRDRVESGSFLRRHHPRLCREGGVVFSIFQVFNLPPLRGRSPAFGGPPQGGRESRHQERREGSAMKLDILSALNANAPRGARSSS